MDEPLAYTLHRIPGLYRRWELAELMKPGEDYHLEDAGRAERRHAAARGLPQQPSRARRSGHDRRASEHPRPGIAATSCRPSWRERWRVSPRTLERWRCAGTGPAWLQLNGRVLYRLEDVLAFERARLRRG